MMNASRLLRYSGLGLLLGVLVVGPFFRGFFFWTELLAAICAVSVGFLLWLIGRRLGGLPTGIPGGAAGWGLLVLLGCYLVQFAWAVYPRGNLDWVLRVAAAWMAYVMARQEAGPALRRWLGWGFVLSAAGVAVVGFLEYSGYFVQNPEMLQAMSDIAPGDRIYTTFQYFNAGAVYLMAAVFAAAGIALEDLCPWKISLSASLMTLISLGFFFTLSRGTLLVVPIALLLFLIGADRAKRWPALVLFGAAWAPMLATIRYIGPLAKAHQVVPTLKWVGATALAGALGGIVVFLYLRLRPRVQVGLAAVVAAGALVGLVALGGVGKLLPAQAARLKDINLKTPNVVLRLIYDQDALRMVSDTPMGRGGWGWAKSYKEYQAFNYTARETHDHYAQTAVEAGVPGLVALVVTLGAALWAAWTNRRNEAVGWALASGAALIACHSLIDFDLSFGQIWFLTWVLLGAAARPGTAAAAPGTRFWSGLSAAVVVVSVAGVLFVGSRHLDRAQDLADAGKNEEAAAAARLALRYDPLDSQALIILGDRDSLERAVRLDVRNPLIHFNLAIAYERQQDYERALQEAKAALKYQPVSSTHYSKVSSLAGNLMVDALYHGRLDEGRRLGAELVKLGEDFARRKAVADPLQHLWNAPELAMTPEFKLRLGQALYLGGRYAEAEVLLKEASKVGLLGSEGEVWLYALYERRGDTKAMAELASKPWVRFREHNPVYKAIREL